MTRTSGLSKVPSESEFLRWIYAQAQGIPARVGPGDDLAVLDWARDDLLLVGIDQVLDGVHFDSAVHAPEAIGRKAMNRNLSDCAAMACLPVAALVSVAMPRGASLDDAKQLYNGVRAAASPFDCAIVGGDTAAWEGKLVLTVAVIGKSDGIDPILRSGARAGDAIFVSGHLGGSILSRHMQFTPRIKLARELARTGAVTSMIDLSDGLSRDLWSLCLASGVGAVIEAGRVPIHPDAVRLAARDGTAALDHALNDGEDYELLFTARGDFQQYGCLQIGAIISTPQQQSQRVTIELDGGRLPVAPSGWEARW